MTVGRLRELLAKVPSETTVKLRDIHGDDVILAMQVYPRRDSEQSVFVLETRNDFDYQDELEERLNYAAEALDDEDDFFYGIVEDGYTLEDFEGMEQYEYAKQYMEAHGMV